MKKIISLVCVIAMLLAFAVTTNAATTGSLAFEAATEVTVGEDFLVTIKYIPGADSAFKGGTVKLGWNYDDGVATMVEEVEGMTDFTTNQINIKPANKIYTVKHAATATDAWQDLTEEAVFSVVKFHADKVGTFTLEGVSGTNVTFADAGNIDRLAVKAIAPITITIKPAGPVEERIDGAAVECAKTWTAAKSAGSANTNEYTNVAVAKAECAAGAKQAGFKFVKDDVNNTAGADFVVLADADGIAGEGTVEYTAVMYGVDYSRVSTIYAIPYYVIVK